MYLSINKPRKKQGDIVKKGAAMEEDKQQKKQEAKQEPKKQEAQQQKPHKFWRG